MDVSDWTVEDHIEWMRHHAKTLAIISRLLLNAKCAAMVHYDLPWLTNYEMSPHLDALAVQEALLEHGPCPVFARKKAEREAAKVCDECGGTGDSHYLSCSIWPHNKKVA